jgi:hypothetical protein
MRKSPIIIIFKDIFTIKHINIIKLFTKTNIYEIIFFYKKNLLKFYKNKKKY